MVHPGATSLERTFVRHQVVCTEGAAINLWAFGSFTTDETVLQGFASAKERTIIYNCMATTGVDVSPFSVVATNEHELLLCPSAMFEVVSSIMMPFTPMLVITVRQIDSSPFSYIVIEKAADTDEGSRPKKAKLAVEAAAAASKLAAAKDAEKAAKKSAADKEAAARAAKEAAKKAERDRLASEKAKKEAAEKAERDRLAAEAAAKASGSVLHRLCDTASCFDLD